MSIRGSVDVVTTTSAVGWAYANGRSDGVVVQAVLNHEIIGDGVASDHRPDLAAVGVGKGDCGYSIKFYREIDPLYLPFVSVKVDHGDIELPRAGPLGFGDFFAALYRAHPGAGRSRSVLGGLWTDRTDAAAILKAKAEIGQIDVETAMIVSDLVHRGIAIVAAPSPVNGGKKRNSSAARDQASAIVEEPRVLAALRAVFDDNPLVLNIDEVRGSDTALVQPSAEAGHPAPAECLVVAAPLTEQDSAVEIVRDSHLLPEFTSDGVSRWASGGAHAGVEIAAAQQGLVSRYDLPPGTAAIVGPGTIYRLRSAEGADALKLSCVPARSLPLALVETGNRRETVRKSGVRVVAG